MKYVVTIQDREYLVEIVDDTHVLLNGVAYELDFREVGSQSVYSLLLNGKSYETFVTEGADADSLAWEVLLRGDLYTARVEDEREKRLKAASRGGIAESGEFHLKAPMPGLVVSVTVENGQEVAKGQVLVILESMKMQNELKSPRAGTIARIKIKSGDSVEQKQTLLSVV